MTIPIPVYTFHFLYSSCGCSSKGLPASEELPVSMSTTSKVTLQPTSEVGLSLQGEWGGGKGGGELLIFLGGAKKEGNAGHIWRKSP